MFCRWTLNGWPPLEKEIPAWWLKHYHESAVRNALYIDPITGEVWARLEFLVDDPNKALPWRVILESENRLTDWDTRNEAQPCGASYNYCRRGSLITYGYYSRAMLEILPRELLIRELALQQTAGQRPPEVPTPEALYQLWSLQNVTR